MSVLCFLPSCVNVSETKTETTRYLKQTKFECVRIDSYFFPQDSLISAVGNGFNALRFSDLIFYSSIDNGILNRNGTN